MSSCAASCACRLIRRLFVQVWRVRHTHPDPTHAPAHVCASLTRQCQFGSGAAEILTAEAFPTCSNFGNIC